MAMDLSASQHHLQHIAQAEKLKKILNYNCTLADNHSDKPHSQLHEVVALLLSEPPHATIRSTAGKLML